MADILPFRVPANPDMPLEGLERLKARKLYRADCVAVAATAVAKALSASYQLTPMVRNLGLDDVLPIFVGAMRRELRKSGLFR